MRQSKNNSKFLLNLVTILTNQKMHDRSMMCDRFLSCIGKATLDLIHHVFQELWRLAPQKREKELGDLRFNVDCDLLFI